MKEQSILIAEACEIRRVGLRTIFVEDPRVTKVYEVATQEELNAQLRNRIWNLVIANQTLVGDILVLPRGHFVLLVSEPDITVLEVVYKHGGRGYLSENVSVELLRTVLYHSEHSFLVEPTLMPWVMECLFGGPFFSVKENLLTPREREIIGLLRSGIDRPTIAKHLCIAETTLKTHIKNIARKRKSERCIFGADVS